MDIKEIQLLTGLSEDEINFYNDEGLIFIGEDLDLNKENIEQVKYIKLLLKLEIPMCKIKDFSSRKISLKYVLEEKIKELENDKINIESKEDTVKDILKNINKKKYINVSEYVEELECIDSEEYAELISDLDKIGERNLLSQILITISCLTPIMWFYLELDQKNYNSIGFYGGLSILTTVILTLTWKSYLQQKDKKIGGTLSYILGGILAIILTFAIFIGIDWIQFKLFVPNDYLMYALKKPYVYIMFLFEIEILIMIVAVLCKVRKVDSDEHEWAYKILGIVQKNITKIVTINLILLYMCVTGITVITKDKIIDYSFYNPVGIDYTYDDITKIEAGFLGKKKLLGGNKGDFYYKITLDNKVIELSDATSDFDDTYLEIEMFDKLVLEKGNAQKLASKKNYELCDLDKRYIDRFLRIVEN